MSKLEELFDQLEEAIEEEIVERIKKSVEDPTGWIEIKDEDVQVVIATEIEFEDDDGITDTIVARKSLRELLRQHADDGNHRLRSVLLKLIEEEL